MCDHRACIPMDVAHHHLLTWVQRTIEMAVAIRKGLLGKEALTSCTAPGVSSQLIAHASERVVTIKVKPQWCSAEFVAITADDPPAMVGSITQRAGHLWVSTVQTLPNRRIGQRT